MGWVGLGSRTEPSRGCGGRTQNGCDRRDDLGKAQDPYDNRAITRRHCIRWVESLVSAERCVQLQAIFPEGERSSPSQLHLKGFNGDGYHRHRACQLQQLVMRCGGTSTESAGARPTYGSDGPGKAFSHVASADRVSIMTLRSLSIAPTPIRGSMVAVRREPSHP